LLEETQEAWCFFHLTHRSAPIILGWSFGLAVWE